MKIVGSKDKKKKLITVTKEKAKSQMKAHLAKSINLGYGTHSHP